jgi:sugar (pentulose or hexulose) kinase
MTPGLEQPDVHVGLDLGTSGFKGVAIDAAGRVVSRARCDYATHRPEPGAAEQDPRDWLRALEQVVRLLLAEVPASRWAAIGLSGMIPTLVATDDSGQPTHAAITWEDARAESEAGELRDAVGADALYRSTGQRLDGRYLLPMAMRLSRRGELQPQARQLLGAKDCRRSSRRPPGNRFATTSRMRLGCRADSTSRSAPPTRSAVCSVSVCARQETSPISQAAAR